MRTVRELHDEAMRLSQLADLTVRTENSARAVQLAQDALELEVEAANRFARSQDNEPTRSILFRSAASIALQVGDRVLAERLLIEGLAGYPPPTVYQQLRDLYEEVGFQRHLALRNIELSGDGVQFTMAGSSVGAGGTTWEEFQPRFEAFLSMLGQQIRRVAGLPFKSSKGPVDFGVYEPVLSPPRIGSFALTVTLAQKANTNRSYLETPDEVLSNVVAGVQSIESGDEASLGALIPDESYRTNFIALASRMAPDGNAISMVGLTTNSSQVALTKSTKEVLPPIPVTEQSGDGSVQPHRRPKEGTYRGILVFADARDSYRLGIQPDDGESFTFNVDEAMDDLVRSYFKERVEIQVVKRGRKLFLATIYPASE